MKRKDILKQLEIIKRAVVEIISEEELFSKLEKSIKEKEPLKIKAGFDPTASDIHLGHTVLLRKLRQFQDLGHIVYFLIGDFTATIGDPSGQDKMRKRLTEEEVKRNALTYKEQVFKILNPKRTKVVFNSHWFKRMAPSKLLDLASHSTLAQIMARQDFNQRYSQGKDISLLELFYPLLQAYDSVYLKADIELGGTDQKFNLLLGRELQKDFGQQPQVIIMLPLLEGIDGVQKMSKSLGNYIGINEPPAEIFGKIMSINDQIMFKYYQLLTDEDLEEIKKLHPKEAKLRLAEIITSQYHSKALARKAREDFELIFSQKQIPKQIPEYKLKQKPIRLIDVLVDSGLVPSRNEARRLIQQGAVSIEDKKIKDLEFLIEKEGVLKLGKRRFLKLTFGGETS
ncbi:MAG: tyrosine--tRNA ligase [Candidatus Omnitrophica bacterium]|nr:tyrosine--tRNA ligase [Candidatus Omnitrophota bacterium]